MLRYVHKALHFASVILMSDLATAQSTLSTRTVAAGLEVLAGRRCGLRALLPFTGPAVIASVPWSNKRR
jgi:hypothetical protein